MRSISRPTSRLTTAIGIAAFLAALAAPVGASASPPTASAAAALQSLRPQLPVPVSAPRDVATTAASCPAQILKDGKLVALKTTTYRYRFVKIKKGRNKGKFKRTIRKVRVAVKVSCAKQCVAVVKKRGKYRNVYTVKTVKVKARKRNRIVTVKRRKRVYRFVSCDLLPSAEQLGTPTRIDVLPGSYALLDFGAFQRQAPISGSLRGFVPGKIKLNSDIQVTLTRGTLALGQTPVFIDDLCNNQVSSAIRTGNPTSVGLDPTRSSNATLLASGSVTSIAYTTVKLPLELRNDDSGCTQPYITTGYSEFKQTFFLRGKVGVGGLTKLNLTSPPDVLNVVACLSPGVPTEPCNGFQIPLPILVSTKLIVNIDLSGK